jgi:hypothetical protein
MPALRACSALIVCWCFVAGSSRPAAAGVIFAADCSRRAVAEAVGSAFDGDTVTIPAGTCNWTEQLEITKGISLVGVGIDHTVLRDSVPKNGARSSSLVSFNVEQPKTFRLSGLTIRGGTPDPQVFNIGHVTLAGTAKNFRVDHVKFENQQTSGIRIDGDLWGVIDHCIFIAEYKQGVVVAHSSWGGHGYGDGSWAERLYPGSERAVYIEDCEFIEQQEESSSGAFDALNGARVVFRRNRLTNQNGTSHGADSSQRNRGARWLEIYDNTYTFDAQHVVAYVQWIRAGSGVFFNNSITANELNKVVQASNCRDADAGCDNGPTYPPWGACNGSSPYDQNSTSTGYRCVDQPGSGTSNLLTGDPPTPVQWVGNASEPIYVWNNTVGGSPNNNTEASLNVLENRDYFENRAREGYEPYVYPHPLVGPASPSAPQNLRIIR